MQVNRKADIVSLRDKLGAPWWSDLNHLMMYIFNWFSHVGAFQGKEHGIDPATSYPFEQWIITDPVEAKRLSMELFVRMMPESGREKIKERSS